MTSPRWIKVIRDLRSHLSRTILSVLSIAVGVIAFGGMLTARNTIIDNLELSYRAGNPSDISIDLGPYDQALLRWVKGQPGVHDASGIAVYNGTLTKADGTEQDMTLNAFADFNAIHVNKLRAVSGEYPPKRGNFLLERANATTAHFEIDRLVKIRLSNDKDYHLHYSGALYDVTTPAGPAATRWNMYIDERTLADLDLDARPTRILVQSAPNTPVADKYALADRLTDALGKRGFTVRAVNVNERNEHWATATGGGIILILVLVGGVALVMSGFLIINVVNGLLLSQKKIIGIMKIVGADRWQIFGVYLVMMGSIGVLALIIAMPVSYVLGSTIAYGVSGVINFDVLQSGFTLQVAVLEIVLAILVPILFSAGPIWSALQTTPAQAISEVTPRQQASVLERMLARLEQLPRTIALAFRSLFRNNVRLVMTMLTLIVAGGMFIAILNLQIGLPKMVSRSLAVNSADITLAFGAPIGRIAAINRAAQVTGVKEVEGWLSTQATVVRADGSDGATVIVNGGDAHARSVVPWLMSGRWLNTYSPDTRDEIVLSSSLMESEPTLKVGDRIKLKRAGETKTYRIVGFSGRSGGVGTSSYPAYTHYETVERLVGAANVATSLRVLTTDSSQAFTDNMAEVLRKRFEDINVSITSAQSRTKILANVMNALNIIIILMFVVATLIAVVGGLGLAGTMSLNVMERTREIGVMRAVGAESPDLRMMFVVEGLFIGLLSALISYIISFPLTMTIGNALGSSLRFGAIAMEYNWLGYALWPVIVSTVSVIASLSPAQRASQISIREALAYA